MFSNLLRGLGAMLENDALVSMIGAVICFVLVWFIGPPKQQPSHVVTRFQKRKLERGAPTTVVEMKKRAWR